MEDLHDCEAGVETDEVGEGQGTHGDLGTEEHGLVDVFSASDTLIECVDSFIDIRHQNSVGNKPWNITSSGACLFHFCRQVQSCLVCVIRCLQALNNFYKRHNWYRVHEMHTNNFICPIWRDTASNFCNRNRASIRGKDGVLRHNITHMLEYRLLNIPILARSFHDKVDFAQMRKCVTECNFCEHVLLGGLVHPSFFDFFVAPEADLNFAVQ